MIRVTVEMLPHGDEKRKYHLGTAEIWNTGENLFHPDKGNYAFRLSKWGKLKENWKSGSLEDFDRRNRGPWDLIYLCLKKVLAKRNGCLKLE